MWASMTRKPGQPADYLAQIYANIILEQQAPKRQVKFPEVSSDRIWDAFIKKLFQEGLSVRRTAPGSLNGFDRKIAYFSFEHAMQLAILGVAA